MELRKYSGLLIPIAAAIFFSITGLAGLYRSIDSFFYDIMMHLTPSPQESEDILLVDIDDATIDPKTGISDYPIPREYYGDALLTMKEFGVHSAVFDIEFLGKSQLEFSQTDLELKYVSPVSQHLDNTQQNINEYLIPMLDGYIQGQISRSELLEAVTAVVEVNDELFTEMRTLLREYFYDRDLSLGQGAALFGNAYFGSNLRDYEGDEKQKEKGKRPGEANYLTAVDQILLLVDDAPELLTVFVLDLLNREDVFDLLVALEVDLAEADADTDFSFLVSDKADVLGLDLEPYILEVLSNPSALMLFYDVRERVYRISLQNVKDESLSTQNRPFVDLATDVVVNNSSGIGFTNVVIDPDGTRRRINLISRTGRFYYPQLGFSGLLSYLGNPEIVINKNNVVLEGALYPDEEKLRDVKIPLDGNGYMLINWPHKLYQGELYEDGTRVKGRKGEDSFKHLSFLVLHRAVALEAPLEEQLTALSEDPVFSWYNDDEQKDEELSNWQKLLILFPEIRELRSYLFNVGMDEEILEIYRSKKIELDERLRGLTDPAELTALVAVIESGELSEQELSDAQAYRAELEAAVVVLKEWLSSYQTARKACAEILPGKIAIIGFTASSSTDFGVNPFQEKYPNPGTHASAINTIIQRDFLDEIPIWVSVLLAIVLAFAIYFILKPLKPSIQIVAGLSFMFGLLLIDWIIFIGGGLYLPVFVPLMALLITFVGSTAGRFVSTSKEKVFIRKAFSHYLSTDVINEIMKDPDKLKLGGDSRVMTAIFTDVKGFSTISEKLTPVDLVHLLNEYLSDMSDIILDLRGLIDKYEGDAIIAFFGAPHDVPDHAYLSCLAAVRMKRVERELNKRFLDSEMTPTPLLTRIGVNTGEMVVGNMGTATKMNYTMMGSAVNLAARLEGVNKQYGTWILISEETYREGGNRFFCRRIDRVRVVGIRQPVQLYEVIEEEDNITQEVRRGVDFFHKGLDHYEARRWTPAIRCFKQTMDLIPQDPPSIKYIQRCEHFLKKAPPADWDGVTNLTSK